MIRIVAEAWDTMLRHARDAYPLECCGILLGRESTVTAALPCRNVYEGDRSRRFQLDPEDQFAAQRQARENGESVIGFFHSHPDTDACFSETDLANSWPGFVNVVLSMRNGAFDCARAFRVTDDQTAAAPVDIIGPCS